ncbi:MAG TPA: class I SAM-dependent methyltransferase [Firmicutes bacterium]|nr:class I SAM-dependent methyltransferase [Bacillota bacterium]
MAPPPRRAGNPPDSGGGCGSGLFCRRLKARLPTAEVTGPDRDAGHLACARAGTREQGLACRFARGKAERLPYENAAFDLCLHIR